MQMYANEKNRTMIISGLMLLSPKIPTIKTVGGACKERIRTNTPNKGAVP